MSSDTLKGEIALVTGASRGIGQAIAMALGAEGAIVVGTATSDNGAQAITAALRENSIEGQGMLLDVTDQTSADNVISAVTEAYGAPPFW